MPEIGGGRSEGENNGEIRGDERYYIGERDRE
jgi:hypothetical protein